MAKKASNYLSWTISHLSKLLFVSAELSIQLANLDLDRGRPLVSLYVAFQSHQLKVAIDAQEHLIGWLETNRSDGILQRRLGLCIGRSEYAIHALTSNN